MAGGGGGVMGVVGAVGVVGDVAKSDKFRLPSKSEDSKRTILTFLLISVS